MVASEQDLERIARQVEGDLKEVAFAVLLHALARAGRSITVEITRNPLVKQIVIEDGVPVQCRPNLAHETLSRFMQSAGLLDQTTAIECFAESCSRGVRFGDVLIDRGCRFRAPEPHQGRSLPRKGLIPSSALSESKREDMVTPRGAIESGHRPTTTSSTGVVAHRPRLERSRLA